MKVYISGPMTGKEGMNFDSFRKAEERLKEEHTVLNPIALPEGLSYNEYMQIDMAMVSVADAIYLLEGWNESPGAMTELRHAISLKKKVLLEEV